MDPGCASGCPTLAYQKDELTGIVKHLDDQCMGCQYCTWTCPYDAPKWNDRLGIVRKCVQACPSQAIRVVVVETAKLEADLNLGTVLPESWHPSARGRPPPTRECSRKASKMRAWPSCDPSPRTLRWPFCWS
ncbi:MAG: 4Fe-4S binding protein [Fibrobacteres bacterium]|nr:4Fe-4S binding protein [Fibrobacterota bacterium]